MNGRIVGLDIGGANIKAATNDEQATSLQFPLWQRKSELETALSKLIERFAPTTVAATMTGELADCFQHRREGVSFIVDALGAATTRFGLAPPMFYQLDGKFVDKETARTDWAMTAASNWNAIARFSSRLMTEGILIDLGSTTCDIVPFAHGSVLDPVAQDFDRLRDGRLVYAGLGRTPICSLISSVQISGTLVPIAREFFATVRDALIHQGLIAENANCHNSADGRSNSRSDAERRIAKMVCLDDDCNEKIIAAIATETTKTLRRIILESIERVKNDFQLASADYLVAGEHPDLVKTWLQESHTGRIETWADHLSIKIAEAAGAYSVAKLAENDLSGGQ